MSNSNIINYDGFKSVGTSTKIILASELEIGKTYEIITAGDTVFTAIGAADNVVGTTFTATDIGVGTGTVELVDETGVGLSDNFNTWRKKTNGVVEKINLMDADLVELTTNAALLNGDDVQNFTNAIGGEFKDYGTMSSENRTIDLKDANTFKFKLQADFTLLLDNLSDSAGCSYTLIIESEGDYEITWPSEFKFVQGSDVLSTTGSSAVPTYDILRLESDGTNLYSVIDSSRRESITVQHDGTNVTDIKGCTISRTSAGKYTITVPDSGNLPTAVASLAYDWQYQSAKNSTLTGQRGISARTIDNTTILVECVTLSSYGAQGGGNDGNTVSFFSRTNVDAPFQVIINN